MIIGLMDDNDDHIEKFYISVLIMLIHVQKLNF